MIVNSRAIKKLSHKQILDVKQKHDRLFGHFKNLVKQGTKPSTELTYKIADLSTMMTIWCMYHGRTKENLE